MAAMNCSVLTGLLTGQEGRTAKGRMFTKLGCGCPEKRKSVRRVEASVGWKKN